MTIRSIVTLSVLMTLEGPIATVAAGSVSGRDIGLLLTLWVLAILADVVADSTFFAIGRRARRPGGERLLGRLRLTSVRLDRMRTSLRRGLPQTVVAAKVADLGAIPAFLAIGWSGIAYRRFAAWILPVSAVRAAALLVMGVFVGAPLARSFESPLAPLLLSVALALTAAGLVLAVRKLTPAPKGTPT